MAFSVPLIIIMLTIYDKKPWILYQNFLNEVVNNKFHVPKKAETFDGEL